MCLLDAVRGVVRLGGAVSGLRSLLLPAHDRARSGARSIGAFGHRESIGVGMHCNHDLVPFKVDDHGDEGPHRARCATCHTRFIVSARDAAALAMPVLRLSDHVSATVKPDKDLQPAIDCPRCGRGPCAQATTKAGPGGTTLFVPPLRGCTDYMNDAAVSKAA